MATKIEGKTAAEWREEAEMAHRAKEESFERCDTDGFLSQWAHGLHSQLAHAKAKLADNGGMATKPALFNLKGERVRAKLITTKPPWAPWTTQLTWALVGDNGRYIGFVNDGLREKNIKAKGFYYGYEECPCEAKIEGRGHGLSGSAWVAVVRADKGYPDNAVTPIVPPKKVKK